jgi:hypothetical protein
MTHPRRKRYHPRDLLHDVQGDAQLSTVLTILEQNGIVLGLRTNGMLRVRILGRRTLPLDLAQLVARWQEDLLAVVRAHQAEGYKCVVT